VLFRLKRLAFSVPYLAILQLSIIIVNYNVRYFLEQCLHTVYKAGKGIDMEVIVVDNNSTDGSVGYLQPLFPGVQFISNNKNNGFARANNQALAVCRGEYVLFLNPDTLIPEECLHKSLSFIKDRPTAGAVGVRMLDDRGRFLAESKRAFPSPIISLFKLVGLAALFPKSALFNRYALGNLNEHKDHSVEVLAGAFMLAEKALLLQLKGFDESYFLYGEDIDLSYRIRQQGLENFYFSGTSIIHFKGESSDNTKLTRVKYFYKAMLVFVAKHYTNGSAKIFSGLLKFAIALRAILSACKRLIKPVLLPLTDGLLVWFALQSMRVLWINEVRNGKDFGVAFVAYALPAFSALFVLCGALTGLYDRRYKVSKTFLSLVFSVLGIMAVYSLLPENLRFSRGVILWGTVTGGLIIFLLRQLFYKQTRLRLAQEETEGQTIMVATGTEYAEAVKLLEKAGADQQLLGYVSPDDTDKKALCPLQNISSLEKNFQINRIIFCIGRLSLTEIISQVQLLSKQKIQILFYTAGSGSMVSGQTLASGNAIITSFIDYRITHPYQKRMKRVVDVLLGLLLLLTFPFHFLLHPRAVHLIGNAFYVVTGTRTWIGYAACSSTLPGIKKGIITSLGKTDGVPEDLLARADKYYAKNYDWWQDVVAVSQNYRQLGQRKIE
jgi:GT2 family glycosyltransferase